MTKGLVITIVMLCMIGCTNRDDKFSGILGKEKMQAVMWDIIGADVFTEQYIKKDSLKNAPVENMQLQNKIFALHQVSRADFYKSYDYYVSHTDLMRVILDSMTSKAERDRTKMIQQQAGARPNLEKPALKTTRYYPATDTTYTTDTVKRNWQKKKLDFFFFF